MGVSVVIPNYNGEKYINKCLDSLLNQSLGPDEIIIVDNKSTDGSLELINSEFRDKVYIISLEKNTGFSVAVNEGIRASNSEFVVLLNNDTELDKDWLKELYAVMQKDNKMFSCCSKMIRYDNRNIIDDAGDEYSILGWSFKRGDGKTIDKYNKTEEVFSSCAGAAIYRKSILDEIGYFDENFFAYLEDIDISYRAKSFGYKNYYSHKAKVYHIGSATSGSRHNSFKVRLAARNNIFLIYKNMPIIQLVINLPFILFGILIKSIYFTLKGLGKSYIWGIKDGIVGIKNIDRVRIKNNIKNYVKIELELLKNTINLFKRG
ncbi:glycosyltransferase family 2 protein [Clostridium tertium]|uniref:glycosyltransferase family 2 protein n=1 Tax=Clostridium tertium TaxID=1559 RepID=UPI00351FD8C0